MYNIESIIRAFVLVQRKFPEATLAIVGTGSEESQLKRLVVGLGLRSVAFYGFVSPTNLPAIYSEYDIYVNASRVDNFPGALVEAACSGLPIVSTGVGGIPDMIRHRETGLIVDLEDHDGLASNVIELVEDQELARGLARSARRWAEQFAWKNIRPILLQCYGFEAREPVHVEDKC
jgi:phenylacetate-CoA ligase